MKKPFILALLLAAFGLAPLSAIYAAEAPAKKEEIKKEDKKSEKSEKSEKKEEGSKPPADVSGGRFAGDPVYVHLAPMILPVITANGAEQIVTLQITIEVKDFDAADNVHTNMPKVMDSLMRGLYGGLGNGDLRVGQLVNVPKIKTKAVSALAEVIGADNIRDVLIEAVAQRRL